MSSAILLISNSECRGQVPLVVITDLDGSGGPFVCSSETCTWTSDAFSIAGASEYVLSADLECIGIDLFEDDDYLTISYRIDNGSWIPLMELYDDFRRTTFTTSVTGSGLSMQLKIDSETSHSSETYLVHKLMVETAESSTFPSFPPDTGIDPECGMQASAGTLIIDGGDLERVPTHPTIMAMIEHMGGLETHIVASYQGQSEVTPAEYAEYTGYWVDIGFETVSTMTSDEHDMNESNTEPFVADLKVADGMFMRGGRQWRIVDTFGNADVSTLTLDEMWNLLERGGVIGGTSAGATVQGDFMPRGDTSGSGIMISEEPLHQQGFRFLANVAFDVHVSARGRITDLKEVLEYANDRGQDLLGIGIDEDTAIVVQGKVFEVIGSGVVYVHTWNESVEGGYILILRDGDKYNLCTRQEFVAGAACVPSIPGDITRDCRVDNNDIGLLSIDWLSKGPAGQWLASYNGPDDSNEIGMAIAIDSNDNIYVTGESYGFGTGVDVATIKYSPDNNQPLWVARYNGPDDSNDESFAIAIDSNDNIYVTGHSYGFETGVSCFTIKYSPDSNQPVWVARYDSPDYNDNSTYAIAIDSNDNIYVTGFSYNFETGASLTIKYPHDSNQPLWVATYNSPDVNTHDSTHAIAIDSNDNIYVTGMSYAAPTYETYLAIKYSPDSNQPLWVARYNGPGDGPDTITAIAIDSNDNIYVTGESYGLGTSVDVATIKYSPDSNRPVWVARYSGQGNGSDSAYAIAIDSNDNIYVTGDSYVTGPGPDVITIKYSPDSNQSVWVARYNGPDDIDDTAVAIAIDSNDNIYVTGDSFGFGTTLLTTFYLTIKYSPDSNQPLWVARYNRPDDGTDISRAIAIDSNDNIYVTGLSEAPFGGLPDCLTIKYSPFCLATDADINNDCKVDLKDFAIIAMHWLECNLVPPIDCW